VPLAPRRTRCLRFASCALRPLRPLASRPIGPRGPQPLRFLRLRRRHRGRQAVQGRTQVVQAGVGIAASR
jgi:hypothetical protein